MGSGVAPALWPPGRRTTAGSSRHVVRGAWLAAWRAVGRQLCAALGCVLGLCGGCADGGSRSIGRLGPVSCTRYRASTSGLSTWWSTTALEGDLVLRGVSRLDAFSGYPVRT